LAGQRRVRELMQMFHLVPCGHDGGPDEELGQVPPAIQAICAANAALYRKTGFFPPWIGYLAVLDKLIVGGGGFVGPPQQNRAELAYFTLQEHEGRGLATRTAAALVSLARQATPGIELFAKTLPERNASTTILSRLGFHQIGTVADDEIGEAWAWLLPAASHPSPG
jgi:ribosomal-protein-alanine N-acetyltransferase